MKKLLASILVAFVALASGFGDSASAQDKHPATNLKFRLAGPSHPSGRISDIIVAPDSKAHWYVATAVGGLWETRNGGTTWKPLFDNYTSYAIGSIAIDPNDPLTLWVGTGENNAQRAVGNGDGLYVTRDGGKSFKKVGLDNSGHISQIWVHPSNSNLVLVAAQGPLWSDGGDRGLYRTLDGGETWDRILEIDQFTGINEFVVNPNNPDLIVASSYQRRRHVWTLINGGPGSGVHRSTDGGNTWTEVKRGLPSDNMGRIGLAGAPSEPNRVYAIIEASDAEKGVYMSADFGQSWKKQSGHMTTSAQYYNELFVDPHNADRVYSVDTFSKVSEDAGKTFKNIGNGGGARHVDDHAIWIDPADTDHLLIGGDGGMYETWDRGATWRHFENLPIVQFYRIQPDNDYPFYNICGGTQDNNSLCGPSRTTNIHGITNSDWRIILGGDGYEAVIDPEDPNIIYTQYQYGGLARYDRRTQERVMIAPRPERGEKQYKFNWNTPIIISPHSRTRLYYAAEYLFRSDDRGDSWTKVSPDLTRQIDRNALEVMDRVWSDNAIAKNASTSIYGSAIGLSESRLKEGLIYIGTDDGLIQVTTDGGENWTKTESFKGVPDMSLVEDVLASSHDVNVAYAVIDNHKRGDFKPYVLKTTDQGKRWKLISGDLPERGTAHTIVEDPVNPDLLFVGTEMGVYVTRNGGENWTRMKNGLPTIAVRDLEIQEREGDLVVGTFGRGAYILDDYSALRSDVGDGEATVFPIREALQYIPGDLWGGRPNQHHGQQWWRVENPPFGAVIRYALKDGYQTLAKTRRKAEIAKEKENEDTPYPSWDELRREDEEEAPSVMAVIRDSDGKTVRRLKARSGKGLNEVVWDLRYDVPGIARLKEPGAGSFGPPPRGPMALPGEYSVTLYKRIEGLLSEIAPATSFSVKALDLSPEITDDRGSVLAFQMRTTKIINAISGAGEVLKDIEKHLKYLGAAFTQAPASEEAMQVELRGLMKRAQGLRTELYGDRTVSSRNESTELPLGWRARMVIFMGWGSQADIGGQQQRLIGEAEAEFGEFLPRLKALKTDLKALEAKATAIDAPWSPGRMPEWP